MPEPNEEGSFGTFDETDDEEFYEDDEGSTDYADDYEFDENNMYDDNAGKRYAYLKPKQSNRWSQWQFFLQI